MEESQEKYILNLAGSLTQELESLLEVMGYTIIDSIENDEEIDYILVRDHEENWQGLKSQYNLVEKNIQIVSLSEVKEKDQFFDCNGRVCIDETLLDSTVLLEVFKRIFTNSFSLRLESNYGSLLENFNSLKITGHVNVGYFTDIVTADMYSKDFNVIHVRNYLTSVTSYLAYLEAKEIAYYPLDINFGAGKDSYVVQISVQVSNFLMEYIKSSLSNKVNKNPVSNLLDQTFKYCDVLEILHLEQAEKVVFTAAWKKDYAKTKETDRVNFILSSVYSLAQSEKRWTGFRNHPEVSLEASDFNLDSLEDKKLPGRHIEKLDITRLTLGDDVFSIEKLVTFVTVEIGKKGIDPDSLTIEQVTEVLEDYPNQSVIEGLTKKDRMAVLHAVQEPQTLENIQSVKEHVFHDVEENEQTRDQFFDSLLENLEGLSLDEMDEFVRVKGQFEDIGEDSVRIKGSGGANKKDDVFRVRGNIQEKEGFFRIKGSGGAIDIGNDSIRIGGVPFDKMEKSVFNKGANVKDVGNGRFLIEGSPEPVELTNDHVLIPGDGGEYTLGQDVFVIKGAQGNDQLENKAIAVDDIIDAVESEDGSNSIGGFDFPIDVDLDDIEITSDYEEKEEGRNLALKMIKAQEGEEDADEEAPTGLAALKTAEEERIEEALGEAIGFDFPIDMDLDDIEITSDFEDKFEERQTGRIVPEPKDEDIPASMMVKGQGRKKLKENKNQLVKIFGESKKEKEPTLRFVGRSGDFSDEEVQEWRDKRGKIVDAARERLEALKNEGADFEFGHVKDEISNIISSELNLEHDPTNSIADSVIGKTVSPVANVEDKEQIQEMVEQLARPEEVDNLRVEVKKREDQIHRMMKLMDGLKKKVAQQSQMLNAATNKGSGDSDALKSDLHKANTELATTKNALVEKEKEINKLIRAAESGNSEESANESINILRKELEKLKKEVSNKDHEIIDLKNETKELDKKLNDGDMKDSNESINILRSELKAAKDELKTREEQVQSLSKQKIASVQSSSDANETVDFLKEQLDQAQKTLSEKSKALSQSERSSEKVIRTKDNYIKKLEKEIDRVNKSQETIVQNYHQEGGKPEEVKKLEGEKASLENLLSGANKKIETLFAQVNSMKNDTSAKKLEIDLKNLEQLYKKNQLELNNFKGKYDEALKKSSALESQLYANQKEAQSKKNAGNDDALKKSLQEKDMSITKLNMDLKSSVDQLKEAQLYSKNLSKTQNGEYPIGQSKE